jgi:shikimate kinase
MLIGGPGQGKSTLGQYLAQIHRASILGIPDQVQKATMTPLISRIPFRIILREYAQWLIESKK